MAFLDPAWMVFLALLLDLAIGDPAWLYARLWHPVVVIGKIIAWAEAQLNRGTRRWRLVSGGLMSLTLIALAAMLGWLIHDLSSRLAFVWLIELALASSLLAFQGLYRFIKPVERALLAGDLAAARQAVAHVVGRDPHRLDQAGVARAAIESLAENYSDGAIAPLFWYAIAGLPGLLAYKTINTLDSMIGHRSQRYEAFGKLAARIDDTANWLPARLTGLAFALAARLTLSAALSRSLGIIWRDAGKHRSVNAGWPESAMAAALGLKLAGPRDYGDYQVDDPWIGEGRSAATGQDMARAFHLFWVSTALVALICLAAAFALALKISETI